MPRHVNCILRHHVSVLIHRIYKHTRPRPGSCAQNDKAIEFNGIPLQALLSKLAGKKDCSGAGFRNQVQERMVRMKSE